jgi:HSP20 family protein
MMNVRRVVGWPSLGMADGFAELERVRRDLDRILQGSTRSVGLKSSAGVFPLVNISHDQDHIYVRSEIPGVTLEDLEVTVSGKNLTIAGERKIPVEPAKVRYHRREREDGRFRRQINLPIEVDGEQVQAKYQHGILMIVLPKTKEAKPRQIPISG